MVALRDVSWAPGRPGVELQVVDRAELWRRFGATTLVHPERLDFHLILHCTGGSGSHMVDFENVELRPHRIIHIRPGQIHRWQPDATYDATLILMRRLRDPSPLWAVGPRVRDLDPDRRRRVAVIESLVVDEGSDEWPDPVRAMAEEALRDLLYVAMGLATDDMPLVADDPYRAFRLDLERHLLASITIAERAARVGYSARTLNRACRRASGRTAKVVADQRLALEARRLLALPGMTATAVAHRLGFAEPTNFTKFMKRTTGRTPSAWRPG